MFVWELILVAEEGSPGKTEGERKLETTLDRVDQIVKKCTLICLDSST